MNFQCFDRDICIPSGFLVNNARCCATFVAKVVVAKVFSPGDIRNPSFALPMSVEVLFFDFSLCVVDPVVAFDSI